MEFNNNFVPFMLQSFYWALGAGVSGQQDRHWTWPVIMMVRLKDGETWTLSGSSGFGRKGWICGSLQKTESKELDNQ